MTRHGSACTLLLSVPGIGLLTATDLVAATSIDMTHFQDVGHFSSWFGLMPRVFSSGASRFLGRISKKGDDYLRMLLTHGARIMLRAANVAEGFLHGLFGTPAFLTRAPSHASDNWSSY